jgi:signal transduction histidine kinase
MSKYLSVFSLLACICWLSVVNFSHAQGMNKQKLTASYMYNFAKNIEWPDQATMTSFDIGVYGAVSPALMVELGVMRDKVQLRGLPLKVKQLSSMEGLAQYQMIYLEAATAELLAEIYRVLDGKPVLLVTSDANNKQLVMINLITTEDHIKFEVNKSNIINNGLTPLPELILNGGTEIDVAKLYREGQASLIGLQKQLASREKTLNDLTVAIKKQERQMEELTQNIAKSDEFIAEQKEQLRLQELQISNNEQEREKLLKEVALRTEELDEQQLHLNVILREIREREEKLAILDKTIKEQEGVIQSQKNAIVNLDELVNSQNVALRYLWGSVILGVLLIITVVIAYLMKRRDNLLLAAQTQDLQIARDRLTIAKRKAEDASQAKSQFLSLMSHELRTPLQAIIGYTEVVIEELRIANDIAHTKDLERVISNSERLLKLINSVLDLAKIESGKMDLDLTEVRLSSLVDEAVATVSPLINKNSIRLKVKVDDGNSLPVMDPEKFLHILINLLGNAIKFSANGQVTIDAVNKPDKIILSVTDTGVGISEEEQARIFEPFKQADSGNSRKYQGTGLGLSITRQLCELMNGKISLFSKLGEGSTFTIEIPLPIKPNNSSHTGEISAPANSRQSTAALSH